jgi:branched-chain amino acid transport system permease protein
MKPMPYVAGAVGFAVAATIPLFVSEQYLLFILSLTIINAIIAVGLNITNGYLGILNLSVAGQVGAGVYTCAVLALNGVPVPLAILAAVVIGATVSVVIFYLFARLVGFFFGLATIAAAEVIRLLIRNVDTITNGVRGLQGYPKLTETADSTYWVLLLALAAVLLLVAIIVRSPTGVRWRAIRDNPGKAASLGIPVRRLQFAGFALSGAIMSLGGAFLALLLQFVEPGIAGLNTLVQAILMVALGGPGSIVGPVIGALAITTIPEFLRAVPELRLVLYGVTLIIVILVIPGGIMGALARKVRDRQRLARTTHDQAAGIS